MKMMKMKSLWLPKRTRKSQAHGLPNKQYVARFPPQLA